MKNHDDHIATTVSMSYDGVVPPTEQPAQAGFRVLTIGHSNHSMEHFLELLRLHAVQVVADVRSSPYSCLLYTSRCV